MPAGDLPDFDLQINGAALPHAARVDVRSITVQEDVDALSMFTVELYNWDDEALAVTWSDRSLFAVGNAVKISLGYLDDLHEVMDAEITGLEPVFSAGEPPTLTVRGYDYRHRLARARRTRTFARMKDSAIATQIAREAGLRADVTDTKVSLEHVIQSNLTDLDFLQRRADLLGWEVYVRARTLHLQPPKTTGQAAVTLTLAEDVVEFAPRLSARSQVGDVSVRGWDVKQKQSIVGQARVGQERSTMGGTTTGPRAADRAFGKATIAGVRQPVSSKAEADQMALGRFNEVALSYIQGELTCHGRADLRAGALVHIAGAGDRFSGPYYVTSATHVLTSDHSYETSLTVRRNAA